MREANQETVTILQAQFKAMDTDGSGELEEDDFPKNLEVEITTTLVSKNIAR
jgi:hypothetical protein